MTGPDPKIAGERLLTTLENPIQVDNFIKNEFVPPSACSYLDVKSPPLSEAIVGRVALSDERDVQAAVSAASDAFPMWSKTFTLKARAAILLRFHALVQLHAEELANLIVLENGKNMTEALADVAKGNETVEYACGALQVLGAGKKMEVSRGGLWCEDRRVPLGVVVSIVPFNFPFMVPMWTLPIALVMGNTMVLKPSEKVPLTMRRVAELLKEAGVPSGVVNLVQGTRNVVESLIDHPDVRAVTFVGSSPVASLVSSRCHTLNKRCTALGGAKNHLVALPDCEVESASSDIVVSYAGCAGQRCMAASVLLIMGQGTAQKKLLDMIVDKSSKITAGIGPGEMGPVIDEAGHDKILKYIEEAEKGGAEVLLDGRSWYKKRNGDNDSKKGNWIGPTIIKHHSSNDAAMKEEIFGPVLSVYHCSSWAEAMTIENSNPFGNAACIYTTNGGNAEWFVGRFRAGMLGVNIGIPVPREPFSFGGLYGTKSKFGDLDITGDGAIEFFSNRIKVTSRWPLPNPMKAVNGEAFESSDGSNEDDESKTDHANFSGQM